MSQPSEGRRQGLVRYSRASIVVRWGGVMNIRDSARTCAPRCSEGTVFALTSVAAGRAEEKLKVWLRFFNRVRKFELTVPDFAAMTH